MNYAKRAIIMAAGKGQRMQPVTLTTPKPMIRVNGVRMIDTIIRALHEQGITEIYIVVGYLKEKFEVLTREYEGITLIENPWYDTCNNISSLYVARDYIGGAIILDGDQIIRDSRILQPAFTRSGYSCIRTEEETGEWLMQVDEAGIVTSCSRTGGSHGWQLFSVSRWNEEDGAKLKAHLEYQFETCKNRQIYWDDVALFCHPEDYQLGIYPMDPAAVSELDNFSELCEADPSYLTYAGPESGKEAR